MEQVIERKRSNDLINKIKDKLKFRVKYLTNDNKKENKKYNRKYNKKEDLLNNIVLKLITILILMLIIITIGINSFAFSSGDKIVAKEKIEVPTLMKFGDIYIMCSIAEVEKNGKKYFAYCIDPKKDGVEIYGQYNLTVSKKIDNNKIYSALIHGYPNKTPKELGVETAGEAYLATTQAIFTMMYNRSVTQYSGLDTAAGKRTYEAYKRIVFNARNYPYNKTKINISIANISDWILSEDKLYLEKIFKVNTNTTNGKYNLYLKNNNIGAEILINNNVKTIDKLNNLDIKDQTKLRIPIKNLNESGNLDIEVDSNQTFKVAYEAIPSDPAAQKLAIIGVEEIEKIKNNINVEYFKNNTKLEILKLDNQSKEPLDSVKFNIYNEKNELIYENLETDEEGKIIIEGMLPGKYIIKEVSTKEGYILLDKEIEIDVEFNKITNIVIDNEKEEIPKEETRKIKEEIVKEEIPKIEKTEIKEERIKIKEIKKVLPQTGY